MPKKNNIGIINLTGDQINALLHALEELNDTEINLYLQKGKDENNKPTRALKLQWIELESQEE